MWDKDLAKMFKERNNKQVMGNLVGEVISLFPNIRISILDGSVILEKSQLYCCDHVLSGYSREFTSTSNGNIITHTPPEVIVYDNHTIMESLDHSGEIAFTNSLKVGDEVLLVSTSDEQTWFIIDKITKL